jgi:hypothetical protein
MGKEFKPLEEIPVNSSKAESWDVLVDAEVEEDIWVLLFSLMLGNWINSEKLLIP